MSTGTSAPLRVLVVCWGNICRSPTAEGVLRHLARARGLDGRIAVDSAGTSGEHAGSPPDERARAEASRRGIDLDGLAARKVEAADAERFDLILVADDMVERQLRGLLPPEVFERVHRITAFGPDAETWPEVPDPYYGGAEGFEQAFELLERACNGLLDRLEAGELG